MSLDMSGRQGDGRFHSSSRRLRWGAALVLAALMFGSSAPAGLDASTAGGAGVGAGIVPSSTTSDNWSGYVAGYGPYAGVAGTFTVPTIAPTPWVTFTDVWVGIDGVGANEPLIQAGIEEIYDPATGRVHTSAWWETLPDHPLKVPISQVGVRAGDRITVSITRLSPSNWQIALDNDTTGADFVTREPYSGPAASAEWIVEAPTAPDGTQQRLGSFHLPVSFSDLQLNGTRTNLTAMTLVRDGAPVAAPGPLGASGFRVSYVAPASPTTPLHVETIPLGQLVELPASGGVPFAQVEWQVSTDLVSWTPLTTLTLDATGRSTYTFAPSRTAFYRALFSATGEIGPDVIKVVVVQPSPVPTPRPSPIASPGATPTPGPSAGPTGTPAPSPAPAGSIAGLIMGPDGAPVSGVKVVALRFPEQGTGIATTAVDGTYSITGLAPGTYRMSVSDPTGTHPSGYVNGSSLTPYGPLASVITVGPSLTRVDLSMPAGETIGGKVTAHGTGIQGIDVMACPALDGSLPGVGIPTCGTATTAADGAWSIAVLPGPYTVATRPSKPYPWTYYSAVGATLDGAAATVLTVGNTAVDGITIALSAPPTYPSLSGLVTDNRGLPVSGIFVDACEVSAPAECFYATTDRTGTYSVDLPPGTYMVAYDDPANVHPSGFLGPDGFTPTLAGAARLSIGTADLRNIDIQLPLGHLVTGRVTGPAGAPLAGIQVAPCVSPACGGQASTTAADGSYTLDLAAGSYVLHYTDWSGLYVSGCYSTGGLASATLSTPLTVDSTDVTGIDVALHGIAAGASPGVTRTGPFTQGQTISVASGTYATVRVAVGREFAGGIVEIQVATRSPSGQWSPFQGLTTRAVGADGSAYYFVRPTGLLAIRAGIRDPFVSALQSAAGLGDVEVFSNPVVLDGR